MTIEELVNELSFEGEDLQTELVSEGTLIAASSKFNFGEYDDMPWFFSPLEVQPYIEDCPEIFNLPDIGALFFCNDFFFLHAFLTREGVIRARSYYDWGSDPGFFIMPTSIEVEYSKQIVKPIPDEDYHYTSEKDIPLQAGHTFCELSTFLTVLNLKNAKQIEHPGRDSGPGKTSGSTAGLPLYSYKELHIDPSKRIIRKEPADGISFRKSPRVHMRRGHLRISRQRPCWVRPSVVGNPRQGIVAKEYRVASDAKNSEKQ